MFDYFPHRTLCDVLEAMRKMYETRNFAGLLGLIEEAQNMGNRMEAAISQKESLKAWDDEWRTKKAELKKLDAKLRKIKSKLPAEK